jgi:hypothetical protein
MADVWNLSQWTISNRFATLADNRGLYSLRLKRKGGKRGYNKSEYSQAMHGVNR